MSLFAKWQAKDKPRPSKGMGSRSCLSWICAAACMLGVSSTNADAQDYPSKPITLIVGYSAGGTTDILARFIGSSLSDSLGQQVIVQNMPGASGMLAAEAVVRAEPDGHVLLFGASNEAALNKVLFKEMPYDPSTDLEPISLLGTAPLILVANPSTPYTSLEALLEASREEPGSVAYGSVGIGTPNHIAGELLSTMADIELTHVPYPGAGPLMPAVTGGHVPVAFLAFFSAIPPIQSGQMIPIGLTSEERFPSFPDIPTIAENGFPGFDLSQWYAAFAPAGTPAEVVELLGTELARIVNEPEMRERMLESGAVPVGSTSEELRDFATSRTEQYQAVLIQAGIEPE